MKPKDHDQITTLAVQAPHQLQQFQPTTIVVVPPPPAAKVPPAWVLWLTLVLAAVGGVTVRMGACSVQIGR